MWIRTQNKYILANANSFRIRKDDIDDLVYYAINGNYDRYEQELGIYSTKEKALKVLDEIQKFISDKQYCAIDNVTRKSYILNKGVHVFEMPKDEDVEV